MQATVIDAVNLPGNWQSYPVPPELQLIGDQWVKSRTSVVLRVPSVVVPTEGNYLLNPEHSDFPSLRIDKPQAFYIDARLLR